MLNKNSRVINVEKSAFKKDETPYLIFACKKCQQYSYVKTSQKTKKCLRCGRSHQVNTILKEGEIVFGMSLAVNTVKRKQNELAIPEFRSQSDFVIESKRYPNNSNNLIYSKAKSNENLDNESKIKVLLYNLSKLYRKFPAYMIEIVAEETGISQQERSILIEKLKKSGFLVLSKDDDSYYIVSQEP